MVLYTFTIWASIQLYAWYHTPKDKLGKQANKVRAAVCARGACRSGGTLESPPACCTCLQVLLSKRIAILEELLGIERTFTTGPATQAVQPGVWGPVPATWRSPISGDMARLDAELQQRKQEKRTPALAAANSPTQDQAPVEQRIAPAEGPSRTPLSDPFLFAALALLERRLQRLEASLEADEAAEARRSVRVGRVQPAEEASPAPPLPAAAAAAPSPESNAPSTDAASPALPSGPGISPAAQPV